LSASTAAPAALQPTAVLFPGGVLSGTTFSVIAGQAFTVVVGTGTTSSSPHASASIAWGDGHTSPGTVVAAGVALTVTGTNTFAAPGTYAVVVSLVLTDPATPIVAQSVVTVVSEGPDAATHYLVLVATPAAYAGYALVDFPATNTLAVFSATGGTISQTIVAVDPSGQGAAGRPQNQPVPGAVLVALGPSIGQTGPLPSFPGVRPAPSPASDATPWTNLREHVVGPMPAAAGLAPPRNTPPPAVMATDHVLWLDVREHQPAGRRPAGPVPPAVTATAEPAAPDFAALWSALTAGREGQAGSLALYVTSLFTLTGTEVPAELRGADRDPLAPEHVAPPASEREHYAWPLYRVADRGELGGWSGEGFGLPPVSSAAPGPALRPTSQSPGPDDRSKSPRAEADVGARVENTTSLPRVARGMLHVAAGWLALHALHAFLPGLISRRARKDKR
jgi:hypothetical protein